MSRARATLMTCIQAIAVGMFGGLSVTSAQPATPIGAELQVNLQTFSPQNQPSVAINDSGGFVVVWHSFAQDQNGGGVFGRRIAGSGAPQGGEFQVNSYTLAAQIEPAVAMNGSGAFVVAWTSRYQDGSLYGVFARRFDSSGTPLGSGLQVNSYATANQRYPVVGTAGNGGFVVVWQSFDQDAGGNGVFARRFDAAGAAQGAEFQVANSTFQDQRFPAIAMAPSGDFVVAWSWYTGDTSTDSVFARRFDASADPQGEEFQVNTYTTGTQGRPAAAINATGDFVVAWQSIGQDGSGYGIFGQRFDGSGARVGNELHISSYTPGHQRFPTVASDGDRNFVVSWESAAQDGESYGVFARLFDSSGAAQAGEFRVNSFTDNAQYDAVAAMSPDGAFVVAWSSYFQDGDFGGVFVQRLAPLAVLDIDGNGAIAPLSDGLLVLRFMFGFSGTTLVSGAVGAGCTRCTAPAIESYLGSLT
ncbi:MAG TPA: hypothetical protein VHR17_02125 [Thermoanaerobaculia bacterium]|nr:hypothetical protein [Thermoanaerobaculia bacterium]